MKLMVGRIGPGFKVSLYDRSEGKNALWFMDIDISSEEYNAGELDPTKRAAHVIKAVNEYADLVADKELAGDIILKLQAERDGFKNRLLAFEPYIQHYPKCSYLHGKSILDCDCGLVKANKEAK